MGVLTLTEGGANGTALPAIAAFTTSFSPDRSFGGPRRAPTMTVRATNQPATRTPGHSFITLRVTASAPGIVRLTMRNTGGQLLGLQVAPIFAAGSSRVPIALTTRGRRLLRRPHPVVRITHQFRDIVAQSVSATRNVRLR